MTVSTAPSWSFASVQQASSPATRTTGVPYWPHLRPEHADSVVNSAYLNRLTLAQWRSLIESELPGAALSCVRDDLLGELDNLRVAGELSAHTDDELLIRNLIVSWRKPALSRQA